MRPTRPRDAALTRSLLLLRLQRRLEADAWPRLQMGLLVALTGAAGLLASFLLLQAGLSAMWLRYPLALALAYLVFLALLWLWLRTRAEDWLADAPAGSGDGGAGASRGAASSGPHEPVSGGGGDFGGAGASAGFDAPASAPPGPIASGGSSSGFDVGDADEFALPLVVIALAIGLALSSFYVVYTAPALLAELLLDGVLAATLYRRLRGLSTRHWIETAVRRTALPFALTAVFLLLCGAAMAWYAPDARSLGEVLRHATGRP
ncbi:hypothetical protein [Hydrogenophaga sp.]|uniref:hypothetical protein n=1 Tax=Hydrogenophaga sp. TaxID=1904254 RepID=UPI0025B8E943|nr:hypothetical protein [Hydrogenophaga sp.]